MRRIAKFLFAVALALVWSDALALTVSSSGGSITLSYGDSSHTDYTYSMNGTNGVNYGFIQIAPVAAEGAFSTDPDVWSRIYGPPGGGPNSESGSIVLATNHWYSVRVGFSTFGDNLLIAQSYGWFFAATAAKKVKISYFNSQDYPVNLKLVDSANPGTTVGSFTLGANAGIIQEVTLPLGVDAVDLLVEVPGIELVGSSWMLVEGGVTTVPARNAIPATPPPTSPPTTTVPEPPGLPGPAGSPGTAPAVNPRPPVWTGTPTNTTDNERLDKATYREGVDKTIAAIDGKAFPGYTFSAPSDSDAKWQPSAAVNATALGKLPQAPTLGGLTASHTLTVHLEIPKLTGGTINFSKTVDFSAPPYSGPIAVFRGLILVLMTLIFFMATFWVVRGAFTTR